MSTVWDYECGKCYFRTNDQNEAFEHRATTGHTFSKIPPNKWGM